MSRKQHLSSIQTNILNFLRKFPRSDKTTVAAGIGVSYPTASKNIDLLIKWNILRKGAESSDKKYKVPFEINPDFYLAGISVGSSQVKVVILHNTYRIISASEMKTFNDIPGVFEKNEYSLDSGDDYNRFICYQTPGDLEGLRFLLDTILKSIEKINEYLKSTLQIIEKNSGSDENNYSFISPSILGIGLSFTGEVNSEEGTIRNSVNLPFIQYMKIDQGLIARQHLDYFRRNNIHTAYLNNTAAAARGDFWSMYFNYGLDNSTPNHLTAYRNDQEYGTIVTLYYGAGTGLDVIKDGEFLSYRNIGHLRIPNLAGVHESADDPCICGGTDCLDHRLRRDVFSLHKGRKGFKEYCGKTSTDIRTILQKNTRASQILSQYMAYTITLIRTLLDPDLIIIGGKMYKSLDIIADQLDEELTADFRDVVINNCPYEASILGPVASAVGAAIRAGEEINITEESEDEYFSSLD